MRTVTPVMSIRVLNQSLWCQDKVEKQRHLIPEAKLQKWSKWNQMKDQMTLAHRMEKQFKKWNKMIKSN